MLLAELGTQVLVFIAEEQAELTKIELLSLPLVQVLVAVKTDGARLGIAQHSIVVALGPLLYRFDRSDRLHGDNSIA